MVAAEQSGSDWLAPSVWKPVIAGLSLASSGTAIAATSMPTLSGNAGILEIVGHADPIVKLVMLILVAASIATWALWFTKLGELRTAKAALASDIALLTPAQKLSDTTATNYTATGDILRMATDELARAGASPTRRAIEGVEERFAAQLPIIESRATYKVLRGTNLIASIGAVAPFVGLAATVWGIMNSFLGIANTKSTSLAVVAPGIAEALFATAMGLAVAIPAVLIYNSLARSIAGYRRLLNEAAVLCACVLSRELEMKDIGSGPGRIVPVPRWSGDSSASQPDSSPPASEHPAGLTGR